MHHGKCIKNCPEGQLLYKGACVIDIKVYTQMRNFWRRNREREDKELMMSEFKRTAIFYGNRVDARVHRLIKEAQDYLAELNNAETKADKTYSQGERVVKVWNVISRPVQESIVRRLRMIRPLMKMAQRRLSGVSDRRRLRRVRKNKLKLMTSKNKAYELLLKHINDGFVDTGKTINLDQPITVYNQQLEKRTNQLS